MSKRTKRTGVTMNGTRLTPLDVEILLDRLEQPDAIAEALTDVADGDPESGWAYDDVYRAAKWMAEVLRGQRIMLRPMTAIDQAVLVEAIEGSVWISHAESEHGKHGPEGDRAYRQLERTARRVGAIVGRDIDVPVC